MQSSIREIVPALLAATAMIAAGVILGLLVASRKAGPATAVASA